MEKKIYEKPTMQVEAFVANHYCSGCGDGPTEVTYAFKCDSRAGSYVWLETNGTPGLQAKTETNWMGRPQGVWNRTDTNYDFTWASKESNWGEFSPCNRTHSITVTKGTPIEDVFPMGYASQYTTGRNATSVRVWTANGTNTHVTTQLHESEFTPHYNLS